jgi:hypothetical protein
MQHLTGALLPMWIIGAPLLLGIVELYHARNAVR